LIEKIQVNWTHLVGCRCGVSAIACESDLIVDLPA